MTLGNWNGSTLPPPPYYTSVDLRTAPGRRCKVLKGRVGCWRWRGCGINIPSSIGKVRPHKGITHSTACCSGEVCPYHLSSSSLLTQNPFWLLGGRIAMCLNKQGRGMLHLYIGCLFWLATTESSKYGKLKVSGESTLKETFPYFF